uniref:Fucosyltransferase n=1 Tax=Ciona intestinalis TaxID=7719 RepID=Q86NA8_CIOIN|nr:alpha3-fucosyltransferase [Ciona intestinalis]CAD61049.1 alpha3-fucosyltransferase [Ciona intestinalis]|eukprot:NP_001027791.1 alpha3-fucosyltransferase [Ciona intestinalis]
MTTHTKRVTTWSVQVLCAILCFVSLVYFYWTIDTHRKHVYSKLLYQIDKQQVMGINFKSNTTLFLASKIDIATIPRPIILMYYKPYDGFAFPKVLKTVAGHECETTFDRSKLDQSEAVVFYYSRVLINGGPDPKSRKRNQKYVYFDLEPTWALQGMNYSIGENGFFNWTMSYKRTSSIYFPYGSIDRIFGEGDQRQYYGDHVVRQLMKRKRNDVHATWVVSNCAGHAGPTLRKQYAESLEKHGLKLDKRGRCYGNFVPPRGTGAFQDFISKYRFYLSFESGYHCHDYITEKLWVNALASGAVPVVWGAPKADVEAVTPPKSFIHVDDFKNAKELAEYLNYLSANDTAYLEYLQWRKKTLQSATIRKDYDFYEMCNRLWSMREDDSIINTVPSINDWFLGEETPECLSPVEHGAEDII